MIDIIFTLLRKGVVFSVVLIFGFVVVYVPQIHVREAEALLVECAGCVAATGAGASAVTAAIAAQTAALEIPLGATSISTASVAVKELSLDMVFNAIAKAIVSSIVASTVDWINSGFKGSPAFVTDLKGFLLETLDKKAFEIIEELGGDASFLCTPFKLDIQIALAFEYENSRENRPYRGCSLSNFFGDFEQFINGDFENGGWRDWLTLTSNPEKYTPVGQYFSARTSFERELAEEKQRERDTLGYGSGYQSAKVCEGIERASGASGSGRVPSTFDLDGDGKVDDVPLRTVPIDIDVGPLPNFQNNEPAEGDVLRDRQGAAPSSQIFVLQRLPDARPLTQFNANVTPESIEAARANGTLDINSISNPALLRPSVSDVTEAANTIRSNGTTIRIPTGLSIRGGLRCAISKPGRMIADRLSKALGLSDDSLISADEIQEIISALFAQLATKALTGTAGLLGLSAGTGYTYGGFGGAYTSAAASQAEDAASGNSGSSYILDRMQIALRVQQDYRELANTRIPVLQAYLLRTNLSEAQRELARVNLTEALSVQAEAPRRIDAVLALINRIQVLDSEYQNAAFDRKAAITLEALAIQGEFDALQLYDALEIRLDIANWDPSTYPEPTS